MKQSELTYKIHNSLGSFSLWLHKFEEIHRCIHMCNSIFVQLQYLTGITHNLTQTSISIVHFLISKIAETEKWKELSLSLSLLYFFE